MRIVVVAVAVAALAGCSNGPADQTNDLTVKVLSHKCRDAASLEASTFIEVAVAKEANFSAYYNVVVTKLPEGQVVSDKRGVDKLKGGTDFNVEEIQYNGPSRFTITSGLKSYPVGDFYPAAICNVH